MALQVGLPDVAGRKGKADACVRSSHLDFPSVVFMVREKMARFDG